MMEKGTAFVIKIPIALKKMRIFTFLIAQAENLGHASQRYRNGIYRAQET
jgi:hypothetical protein